MKSFILLAALLAGVAYAAKPMPPPDTYYGKFPPQGMPGAKRDLSQVSKRHVEREESDTYKGQTDDKVETVEQLPIPRIRGATRD